MNTEKKTAIQKVSTSEYGLYGQFGHSSEYAANLALSESPNKPAAFLAERDNQPIDIYKDK